MGYQPFCLTEIEFLSEQLAVEHLLEISNRNIAFIMSETSVKRFGFHELINSLSIKNTVTLISNINSNPTQEDLRIALNMIMQQPLDLIIAIGGGSAIDLAKGISAFHNNNDIPPTLDSLTNAIEQKLYINRNSIIDLIAIPTTAGTGSELTQWATIWDYQRDTKYSIDHISLKPKKAIIVPEFTLSLSREMTLATGLDALSHATEAYWSKHTTPIVQDLAYRSIQLILEYLQQVLESPENLSLRENMCKASVLAGIAFSHTRTTACHSISYPLTMLYQIPHGIAAAMTLGEVAAKNKGSFPHSNELYQLFDQYGGLQSWLDQVSDNICRLRLSAYQIKYTDIDLIVSKAFTSGRMDNNPVELTEMDVKEILSNIYK